jgi:hexosaminidase
MRRVWTTSLITLLLGGAGVCHAGSAEGTHRLFPAAQVEVFADNSTVLGIVRASQLVLTAIGPMDIKQVIDAACHRFQASLVRDVPDYAADDYETNPLDLKLQPLQLVEIHVLSADTKLVHGVDESYGIRIEKESEKIIVTAQTVFGALHALQTLGQLLEFGWISKDKHNNNDGGAEPEPIHVIPSIPLFIADSPSFAFRGLMIDTARHYLPMALILDNLDVMEQNKLNVLHWHITDSQSWPWRSESYPEIGTSGAFHPKRIYTTHDIQTVVQAAYLRGIRVIPEVDMPGHIQSLANSHPELLSPCPEPSEPLNPANPDVFEFVRTIYKDLKDLFPDNYVHVGGDEVPFNCWNKSTPILNWMKEHNMTEPVELYEYFETRLLDIVSGELEKTPIVWQEVFNLNLTISNDTIVDVWKGFDDKTAAQATNQSYRVILSGCWYLDHLADNWKKFYDCNPRDFNGTAVNVTANVDLMIGGHASMWGEHVDASNFMSRVWPRASAVAERLWTGNVEDVGANNTIFERIHKFRCRMVQQGVAAGPTGPGFCPHEVPYQQCNNVNAEYQEQQEEDDEEEDGVDGNNVHGGLRVHMDAF